MKNRFWLRSYNKSLFTFLLLISSLYSLAGQGWAYGFTITDPGLDTVKNDVVHIPAYVNGRTYPLSLFYSVNSQHFHFSTVVGENQTSSSSLFNPSGNQSMIDYFPKSSIMLGADSTIVLSDQFNPSTGDYDLYATCYGSENLSFMWHQPLYENPDNKVTGAALTQSMDGQFISLGAVQSEVTPNGLAHELLLVKADLAGQVLWTQIIAAPGDDLGVQIIAAPDGGYWLLKNVQPDLSLSAVEIWLIKTDADGNLEWEVSLGNNDVAFDMTLTNDGGLAITGTNVDQDLFVLKTDEIGNQIWRQDYPAPDRSMTGKGIIEDLQNNLVVAGILTFDASGEIDPFIAKLTETGTPLWEKTKGRPNRRDGFNDIALTPGGNYLMGGFRNIENTLGSFHGYLAKTDTFGIITGGAVHGNVFDDLNLDCSFSMDDLNLENWNVQVANDSLNYFGNTDAQGNYHIPVQAESGTVTNYVVSVVPPNPYREVCTNDVPIAVPYLDSVEVDFAIQSLVDCPYLDAQISSTNFRPCEPADIYINYCNTGTAIAEDASITVTLDPFLTFDSSSIMPSEVDGQSYTFPLGDLEINECDSLVISVSVACDSLELGDALCINAQLFPDTICTVPGQDWSGALLQLAYTCDDDSIQYHIENVGTNEMLNELQYIIIEDAVLLMQGGFDLNPEQIEQPNPLPIDGSTFHLIAQQEPGAPGPEWISLGTMGCLNGNAPALNQFSQLPGGPFSITYCPIVVGSFDPNDKQAIPSGFDEEHYILPNTDLSYTIRFQNTGTDTAFRVVITDQLSRLLNPVTIQPGPSSHPYEFKLEENGLLSFNFYDIELPDSSTNLAASQGFVTFKISQQPNLSSGERIENDANIFFDFNPPILTNTTFHTIRQFMDIVSSSVSIASPQMQVKVMPNPMQNGAWIRLEGAPSEDPVLLQLFDINGRNIRQIKGDGNSVWLERSDLTSGMYFFRILKGEIWQASGKLIVD